MQELQTKKKKIQKKKQNEAFFYSCLDGVSVPNFMDFIVQFQLHKLLRQQHGQHKFDY